MDDFPKPRIVISASVTITQSKNSVDKKACIEFYDEPDSPLDVVKFLGNILQKLGKACYEEQG